MLEMLVAGGGKPFYPNSGPGPKSLAGGNEQAGYFGTLTQAQLFTPTELFNLLGIPAIDPTVDTSLIWSKFFYKGKIIYIPSRPINSANQAFSWQELYQMGLVYGIDADGAFPYPVNAPTNQRVTVTKTLESKTAGFWPRLARASDIDPTTNTEASDSGKGEFAELMSNVLPQGMPGATNKWDNIPVTSYDNTNSALMLTSVATAGTGMMIGKANTPGKYNYSSSGKSVQQASWRWWPVLQYINPAEELVDLTDFKADSPPPKAVDVYAVDKGDSVGGLIGVRNVRSDLLGERITPKASTLTIKRPVDVKVALVSPPPLAGATTTTLVGLHNPANIAVELLDEPPRPTVITAPFFGVAVKANYSPVPVTGVKLSDQ